MSIFRGSPTKKCARIARSHRVAARTIAGWIRMSNWLPRANGLMEPGCREAGARWRIDQSATPQLAHRNSGKDQNEACIRVGMWRLAQQRDAEKDRNDRRAVIHQRHERRSG